LEVFFLSTTDKTDRKQLSVRIDTDLHRAFLIALATNGERTQEVLVQCIKDYVARSNKP